MGVAGLLLVAVAGLAAAIAVALGEPKQLLVPAADVVAAVWWVMSVFQCNLVDKLCMKN